MNEAALVDVGASAIYDLDLPNATSGRCPVGDGVELYYEIHGEGTPITFVNSSFLVAPVWRGLTESLRERARCLFYDLRNQGASTPLPGPIQYSDYVADLRALLDHVGIERTYLVGTSISTLAARDFALAYPERVAGLVLVGPAFSPYGSRRRWMMTDTWLSSTRWGGLDGLWKHLYSTVFSDYTIEQGGKTMFLGLRESFLAVHSQEQIEVNLTAANATSDEPEKLRGLQCPTLLLIGDGDLLWGESNREEALRLMPHASLQLIPRVGHLPYFEANDVFQEAVLRFVTECEAEHARSADGRETP